MTEERCGACAGGVPVWGCVGVHEESCVAPGPCGREKAVGASDGCVRLWLCWYRPAVPACVCENALFVCAQHPFLPLLSPFDLVVVR